MATSAVIDSRNADRMRRILEMAASTGEGRPSIQQKSIAAFAEEAMGLTTLIYYNSVGPYYSVGNVLCVYREGKCIVSELSIMPCCMELIRSNYKWFSEHAGPLFPEEWSAVDEQVRHSIPKEA